MLGDAVAEREQTVGKVDVFKENVAAELDVVKFQMPCTPRAMRRSATSCATHLGTVSTATEG